MRTRDKDGTFHAKLDSEIERGDNGGGNRKRIYWSTVRGFTTTNGNKAMMNEGNLAYQNEQIKSRFVSAFRLKNLMCLF